MVKVISAYNFQEQNTSTLKGDIADICLIGSERLAIAQKNHLIEILCLKHKRKIDTFLTSSSESTGNNIQHENCPPEKVVFPTVDQIQKLLYCKQGHFLLALESKADTDEVTQKRNVRIYINFDIAKGENYFSTPIRARIASKITPRTDSANCIEVIEIPIDDNPDEIACCQVSGTILINSEKKLYLYKFEKRINSIQKFSYIDFFEVPFYIELEFTPKKIRIVENVISCMNNTTVVTFKIIKNCSRSSEFISNASTSSSTGEITTKIAEPIDYEVAKKCNQVNGMELEIKIHSNWDTPNDSNTNNRGSNFSEEKPIVVNDVIISLKDTEERRLVKKITYTVESLIQLRQPSNEKVGQIQDEFRSIDLKAIYYKYQGDETTNSEDNDETSNILKSSICKSCIGFSFLVSTVSDGYLYQFTNKGDWYVENTKCLATYPFTAPVLDVIIDNYVIHAITECGIETFSSRIGHKLFSSCFEYPMLREPYPNEVGPLLDVPICVMGICGFFGIKFFDSSSSNLVLISTCSDDKSNLSSSTNISKQTNSKVKIKSQNKFQNENDIDWTLYNLQLPKPQILINDIKSLATIYKTTCPEIYFELLEEAHVIIRLARIYVNNNDINNDNVKDKDNTKRELEKIFMDTCQLLAEYTIMSDRKEIYSQGVAYYSMCKYPVWEIYKRFVSILSSSSSSQRQKPIGIHENLIYTLKMLLSNFKTNKVDIELLTQNVKPIIQIQYPSTSDVEPQQKYKEHIVAEEFLDFFKIYAPSEIATICLSSWAFREIVNDSLIKFYSDAGMKENLKNDEKLCLSLCYLKNNEIQKSIEILHTIKSKGLLRLLKNYWYLLFDNYDTKNYQQDAQFSDFTELVLFTTKDLKILNTIADVFIHLLLQLRCIDLKFTMDRFMNYFAINLGQNGYRQSQQIFEIILQGYFYDFYYITINSNLDLDSDDKIHKEALKILFRMYLGWLKQYSNSSNNHNEQQQQQDKENFKKGNEEEPNQDWSSPSSSCSLFSEDEDDEFVTCENIIDYRLSLIDYMYKNMSVVMRLHGNINYDIISKEITQDIYAGYFNLINSCTDENDDDDSDSTSNDIKLNKLPLTCRPITFFDKRLQFLNSMPPFDENTFKFDKDGVRYFDDWDKEINVILIKIQALLCSSELTEDIIVNFLTFIDTNPDLVGIDSLIAILLPEPKCINFFIKFMPENLLNYGKYLSEERIYKWQDILRKLLKAKRQSTKIKSVNMYDKILKEILDYLANEYSFEEFFECIPKEIRDYLENKKYDKNINNYYENYNDDNDEGPRKHSYDGIDETDPFQLIIRKIVANHRSKALCDMIKTRGRKLYESMDNPMQ